MSADVTEEMSEEELLREREKLLTDIGNIYCGDTDAARSSPSSNMQNSSSARHSTLVNWYRAQLADDCSPAEADDVQMKWLAGVSRLVEEIESSLKLIGTECTEIELEKSIMLNELAGLDKQSKKLLDEQQRLEEEVSRLELEANSVNVIRDVNMLSTQKELLVTSFSRFAFIVQSLELVKADPRQHEHLKSKVCSVAVSVGLGAIDVYLKRMTQYIDSLEGSTLSSVSLFGKFTETLQVVGNISSLFRKQDDREFLQSVVELEKALSDARQKISVPVIGDYITSMLASSGTSKLPVGLRKCVYFVNSVGKQEQSLFESVLGPSGVSSDSFLSLLRSIGLALYYPLRTSVISTSVLSELRESAEILRLEIFSSQEYLGFIQSVCLKLHRDIQERLIYRVESFVRDEIRTSLKSVTAEGEESSTPEFVKKTFECLEIITGVVDSQTFHEIANEAVGACVETLMSTGGDRLFLIAQLLALRERITLIDCEYTLLGKKAPETLGMADQIKRLVRSGSGDKLGPHILIRARIENELKNLCGAFNASVVARTLNLGSDEERKIFLRETREQVRKALKSEGLDLVLTRPILAELRQSSSVGPEVLSELV
jgi:hypothetical protein